MKTALYNKKGVFISEYKSISELARHLELRVSNVSRSIKRGWLIRDAYYAKVFTDTYKEKIPVSKYRLGKEVRCFRMVRGKFKFDSKFKNIIAAADFVKMNHRTLTRKIKKSKLVEYRNKTYLFRFIDKENLTNHVPNHEVHKATGINFGQSKVPIKLIDKDNNEIICESVADAVRKYNMNRVAILHVLAGRQKRTSGFRVKRILDDEK